MLRDWDKLPQYMRTEEVRPYYESLQKKKISLILKRKSDFIVSLLLLLMFSPIFIVLAILIAIDSKGEVFFCQERITQYGRRFKIYKFRTMIVGAEELGSQVTSLNDRRVTKIGKKIRQYRLDELPQLINILMGDMSFVGTRPEVIKFVRCYTPEMMATLLLPAGITSEASIKYKDEALLLANAEDVDSVYVNEILSDKMKYNLDSIRKFSFLKEIATMVKTLLAV
ncbi:MAG TPA: glycosyl transferase, partial [Lachnospiraceae bacterium]|nr:glycosyl transferase [Lachnospiraceae bacterium]